MLFEHGFELEITQCKERDILMFKQPFQCEFGWNKVKYARITIKHACFIALTLARSLGFKFHPLDPPNVNA